MAEKNTQTQTTAAPAATSTPAAAAATDATPRTPTVLSADPFRAAMAKAFAAEASEEDKGGEQRTPDESDETETNETTEGAEGAETSTVEETGEETQPEVPAEDPNGNPDELTIDSELPDSPEEMKGFENLLPWQVKRFKRLLRVNREKSEKLATAGVPVIQPTPTSPLADVETLHDLEQRIDDARAVKAWCAKHAEGYEGEGRNGKIIELTADEVAQRLARAEAEIEAYADAKVMLHERERSQPAKAALQLVPDLLKAGSESNNTLQSLLQICPELKTRFANWEEVGAYVLLGYRQAQKLKQGVKFVEVKPEEKGAPAAQAKPKPKPAPSPSGDKPTLQAKGAPASVSEAVKALPANTSAERRAKTALAAAFSAA